MATQPTSIQPAPTPAGSAPAVAADEGRTEVVTAALAVAAAAAGQKYTWGGHDTDGFDCSGFVIYTLRQALPKAGFNFMTAGQIFADKRFEAVTDPKPGDLIGFRHGAGTPNDHVGIVVDAGHWIGSQSSTGVAKVSMTNVYWSKKAHFFLRLK